MEFDSHSCEMKTTIQRRTNRTTVQRTAIRATAPKRGATSQTWATRASSNGSCSNAEKVPIIYEPMLPPICPIPANRNNLPPPLVR